MRRFCTGGAAALNHKRGVQSEEGQRTDLLSPGGRHTSQPGTAAPLPTLYSCPLFHLLQEAMLIRAHPFDDDALLHLLLFSSLAGWLAGWLPP